MYKQGKLLRKSGAKGFYERKRCVDTGKLEMENLILHMEVYIRYTQLYYILYTEKASKKDNENNRQGRRCIWNFLLIIRD